MRTIKDLQILQNLNLDEKIKLSKEKIKEWYEYWEGSVYVSFSGGKDSTVLQHLVRSIYSDVPSVFLDTGLEWPEIRTFVKNNNNTVWIRPKVSFHKVLEKYGYPVISKSVSQNIYEIRNTKSKKLLNKRLYGDSNGYGKLAEKWKYLIKAPFKISDRCCSKLKKDPVKKYEKETGRKGILGTMAIESNQRTHTYVQKGCNSFTSNRPLSNPLSFWTEKDIWNYIKLKKITYSDIYNKGVLRTGCIFCMFGIHKNQGGIFYKNNFQILKELHPTKYKYCMETLGLKEILRFLKIRYF